MRSRNVCDANAAPAAETGRWSWQHRVPGHGRRDIVTLMDEQDTGSEQDKTGTTSATGTPGMTGRATFGGVFALPEFRALWLAQVLSVVGDQLARVALTLLVYGRTRAALLAAVTVAAS